MFEGDNFLVLIAGGEPEIAALSGVLVFLAVASVRLGRRFVAVPAAVPALGLVLWWLFVWLTPQAYYLLYMVLVEDLGFRWVIGWPPGPDRLFGLLTFRADATRIDFALGVVGWVMCLVGFPRN